MAIASVAIPSSLLGVTSALLGVKRDSFEVPSALLEATIAPLEVPRASLEVREPPSK